MIETRSQSFDATILQIANETEDICKRFADFRDGMRMLILMERKKDGGSNQEDRRVFQSRTTYSPDEFKDAVFELLVMKRISNRPLRLYLSANQRDLKKIIRGVKQALLEADYGDQDYKDSVHKKLLRNPRHFIMQQNCRIGSLFIIDVDKEEGKDTMALALKEISRLDVKEVLRYPTKNGWHIVVEPFNPWMWQSVGEIKKDPLLLLSF